MKIVIMRHGKPQVDLEVMKTKTLPSNQLGGIIDDYETTDLDSLDLPPAAALSLARKCSVSISSDLPRAVSTAQALGLATVNSVDPVFRESALPYVEWRYPKFTFFTWAILFRLLWLCGFSNNGESVKAAKSRAILAADKLEKLAGENETVINVGHGIMNRLVIKVLKRHGWRVIKRTGETYWSYTVLEREA